MFVFGPKFHRSLFPRAQFTTDQWLLIYWIGDKPQYVKFSQQSSARTGECNPSNSVRDPSQGATQIGKLISNWISHCNSMIGIQNWMHNWFTIITSWHVNAFWITDPLCGESTDHRWITLTKAEQCVSSPFSLMFTWSHWQNSVVASNLDAIALCENICHQNIVMTLVGLGYWSW